MNFHVGQKVVCINDKEMHKSGEIIGFYQGRPIVKAGTMDGLKKGAIYTIRALDLDCLDKRPIVFLHEIIRPKWECIPHQPEAGYCATRFRPLIEKSTETGMAILRKIADDISNKIKEKA